MGLKPDVCLDLKPPWLAAGDAAPAQPSHLGQQGPGRFQGTEKRPKQFSRTPFPSTETSSCRESGLINEHRAPQDVLSCSLLWAAELEAVPVSHGGDSTRLSFQQRLSQNSEL